MKKTVGLIALIALLGGACGDDGGSDAKGGSEATAKKGPQTYTVLVDGPSPEGKNIQLGTYFPGGLKVHPGDTVTFDNKSTQAPHTISFGINADRSNSPAPLTKTAAFNPAVFGPCVTAAAPTAALEACPEAPAIPLPAYTGTGYWNSGILSPAVAPAGIKQMSVTFAESTPPGSYNYACILHALMGGSVTVVAPDEKRDTVEEVAAAAAKTSTEAAAAAAAIPDPADPGPGKVVSGWSTPLASINRFLPADIEIKAGQSVTWKGTSGYEPHTISFEPPFKSPEDPLVVVPAGGAKTGSHTGGYTNSGFIGPKPFPKESFSLRFPKAGTYSYVCALHPGMVGTVKVT